MNKDQVKGIAKEVSGAIQRKGGEVIGNPVQEARGRAKQAEGREQRSRGNMKEALEEEQQKKP